VCSTSPVSTTIATVIALSAGFPWPRIQCPERMVGNRPSPVADQFFHRVRNADLTALARSQRISRSRLLRSQNTRRHPVIRRAAFLAHLAHPPALPRTPVRDPRVSNRLLDRPSFPAFPGLVGLHVAARQVCGPTPLPFHALLRVGAFWGCYRGSLSVARKCRLCGDLPTQIFRLFG